MTLPRPWQGSLLVFGHSDDVEPGTLPHVDELHSDGDLVNQVLEITTEDDTTLRVRRYRLAAGGL